MNKIELEEGGTAEKQAPEYILINTKDCDLSDDLFLLSKLDLESMLKLFDEKGGA